ncbi:hypothetical protein BU23DRAFT_86521 [Bimuria novae-zelandiae CBS 107.79]|uniref:HNH nuclease domain-containing protein n=1 Tax=Bimuria novae-zelandiae CBS 107.79 TaxID=1447943 RepID=A0A6A5VGN3_9PLEO|nr:hypothetical protein BU23DRAFT_86521 [Bimuria novae-zelandiae CBS 107.79]
MGKSMREKALVSILRHKMSDADKKGKPTQSSMYSYILKHYDPDHPPSETQSQPQSITERALIAIIQQDNSKRNKHRQSTWAKKVLRRYDVEHVHPQAEQQAASERRGWCPVVQEYIPLGQPKHTGKMAHIVPHKTGISPAGKLFGAKGEDVILSESNAMWLHPKVEEALDNGQIIVVPASSHQSDRDLKLRVVDPELLGRKRRRFGDKV